MAIVKTKNHIEVYKLRAMNEDVFSLSGRGEPSTKLVNLAITEQMDFNADDIVLDIGCGDGTLLNSICPKVNSCIGIAPTQEEVVKLTDYYQGKIKFQQGLAQSLENIKDNFASKIICNGVLLLLEDADQVKLALDEIYRVARKDCKIFIGEIPSEDEFNLTQKKYGDSIIKWLFYCLVHQGIKNFFFQLKKVLNSFIGGKTLIIMPKKLLFFSKDKFLTLLIECKFKIIHVCKMEYAGSNQKESRLNYIVCK